MFDATAIEREFLSPQEFAALSGTSLQTVRRYLADGRLPSIQPGGRRCRVLIPRLALTDFVRNKSGRQPPVPQQSALVPPQAYPTVKKIPGPAPRWLANSRLHDRQAKDASN